MKYYGPLFGEQRGQRTRYWDTGHTGKDWERLEEQRDALLDMLERCEMWLSTAPEGRAMQVACQSVIAKAKGGADE